MSKIEILSETLNNFVDKYFVKMDFSGTQLMTDEEIISLLSEVEKTLVRILEKNYPDDSPSLWYNREMCLRTLVVLTNMDHFAESLDYTGHMKRATMLYTRIVDTFSKKILEDPDIVKAIKENRLEEEMEKRFPKEMLKNTKMTSNFIELVDDKDLDVIPDEYERIPDQF